MNKKIDANEMRILQIKLLDFFVKVCNENDINYIVYYGSLLGAIRHDGFIPWDDDIDIGMVREDYQKFIKVMSTIKKGDYCIFEWGSDGKYQFPFIKLYNNKTLLKEGHLKLTFGVNIDIFPLDKIPNDIQKQQKIKKVSNHLGEIAVFKMEYKKPYFSPGKNLKSIIKWPLRIIKYSFYAMYPIRHSYRKFIKKINSDACDTIGDAMWMEGAKVSCFKKEFYANSQIHKFEQLEVKIPSDYDSILTGLYGDWRTPLPPKDQKVHDTNAFYK